MVNDWFAAIVHSDYQHSALLAAAIQQQARAQLRQRGIRVRCADTLAALIAVSPRRAARPRTAGRRS